MFLSLCLLAFWGGFVFEGKMCEMSLVRASSHLLDKHSIEQPSTARRTKQYITNHKQESYHLSFSSCGGEWFKK